MKKWLSVFVLAAFSFYSCKKDSSPVNPVVDPPAPKLSKIKSVRTDYYLSTVIGPHKYMNAFYTYDVQGRMIQYLTDEDSAFKAVFSYPDANTFIEDLYIGTKFDSRTTHFLDAQNKLDSAFYIHNNLDTTGKEKYVYNSAGLLVTQLRFDFSGGQWAPSDPSRYEYDSKGNLTKNVNPADSTEFTYYLDKFNLQESVWAYHINSPNLVKNEKYHSWAGYTVQYLHTYGFDNQMRVKTDTAKVVGTSDYLVKTFSYLDF